MSDTLRDLHPPTPPLLPPRPASDEASLPIDIDDEAAWQSPPKARRKATVAKAESVLAESVRGGLGKVSMASTPFSKGK